MRSSHLINKFFENRGYTSYLEIGQNWVSGNFVHVVAPQKEAIDVKPPEPENPNPSSADYFFDAVDDCYDVIFIDGIHEDSVVENDIRRALDRLNPGGVIILHDALPPNEWQQRPFLDYRPGESWYGTVWKSVLRYFAESPYRCYIVNTDCGCAVIDTAHQANHARVPVPPVLHYREHFPLLKPYVVSPDRFRRLVDDLYTFYSLACMHEWKRIAEEQMTVFAESGIYRGDLRTTINGTLEDQCWFLELCDRLKIRARVLSLSPRIELCETSAIFQLERWAKKDHSNGACFYFHSKGVSKRPRCPTSERWRWLMMEECVRNWRQCVKSLASHDIVGANWIPRHRVPIFAGNFWWANASWIRKLPDFSGYYRKPARGKAGKPPIEQFRMNCERWLGSIPGPKVCSVGCRNVNLVGGPYLQTRYPERPSWVPELTK